MEGFEKEFLLHPKARRTSCLISSIYHAPLCNWKKYYLPCFISMGKILVLTKSYRNSTLKPLVLLLTSLECDWSAKVSTLPIIQGMSWNFFLVLLEYRGILEITWILEITCYSWNILKFMDYPGILVIFWNSWNTLEVVVPDYPGIFEILWNFNFIPENSWNGAEV